MRKIGANETGNYILEGTIEEVVDSADIVLFEGTNYLYTNYLNIEIMVMFSKNTDENKMQLPSTIFNAQKEENKLLSMDDLYFKDAFTKLEDKLNLEVDNANVECITSKIINLVWIIMVIWWLIQLLLIQLIVIHQVELLIILPYVI